MLKTKLILPVLAAALWAVLSANVAIAADKEAAQQQKETQQDVAPGSACGTDGCCAMHGKMKQDGKAHEACPMHGGKGHDACPMHQGMKQGGAAL